MREEFDVIDGADAFRTRTGYSIDDIARGAREAFMQALTLPSEFDWEEVDAHKRERWKDAVEGLMEICRLEIDISWTELARRMAETFSQSECWPLLPTVVQLGWEVAARQAVNFYMAEDASDIREIQEMDWLSWASRRIPKEENDDT